MEEMRGRRRRRAHEGGSSQDYGLAQDRHRVFLRGLRSRGSKIPMPLPPFGERKLADFLAHGLPPTPRDSFTEQMKKNLSEYERRLLQLKFRGLFRLRLYPPP